ncbi:unnamed protein product [Blumeria hordei]|uniref:Dynactin subunit n=2 Tax=Blumeria hordei TaxID=2867405 RepID=A0A383URG5_BLUHO|nr:dynactin subunit [Blumeria hordei DH14]SZF02924.1 unnamed protein product [Blumeria hordei]
MAHQLIRKYANLPDLDSAPDVYETPELTDDNSIAAGRDRSASNCSNNSSHQDFEDTKEGRSGISKSRLQLDEARSHFATSIVDARSADFSDRLTAKRKSYKVSNRRQAQSSDTGKYGDFSDEEEIEGLAKKFARLKREVEELKLEYEKRQLEETDIKKTSSEDLEPQVNALCRALESISSNQMASKCSKSSKFVKDLGTGIKAEGPAETAQSVTEPATYTVTYAPTFQQSHALAKAADFDARLSSLEKTLGTYPMDLCLGRSGTSSNTILPALEKMQRQIMIISQTTPSSLDSISRQIRSLTQEAKKLEDSRKAAKKAQDVLQNPTEEPLSKNHEDPEQTAKINALYGMLPTIERLTPIIPPLLDRLYSLRAIHADAAGTKSTLDRVEMQQIEMAQEIKKWREGLDKMEKAIIERDATIGINMQTVESWIKAIEEKL